VISSHDHETRHFLLTMAEYIPDTCLQTCTSGPNFFPPGCIIQLTVKKSRIKHLDTTCEPLVLRLYFQKMLDRFLIPFSTHKITAFQAGSQNDSGSLGVSTWSRLEYSHSCSPVTPRWVSVRPRSASEDCGWTIMI